MFRKDKPYTDDQVAKENAAIVEAENEKRSEEAGDALSTASVEKSAYGAFTKSPAEIHAIIQANVGRAGINMSNLTRIVMPSGKQLAWTVPGIRGIVMTDELEGIIIHHTDGRAYWKKGLDDGGGKQPPDCQSADLFEGIGDPGGPCAECPQNVWGSETKAHRGKACKEVKILYFLPKTKAFLPYVFILPPTSLSPIKTYLLGLANEGLRANHVTTILGLEKATNKGGTDYAIVAPRLPKKDGELSTGEKRVAEAYVAAIKPALERRIDFQQGDVGSEEE